MPPVLIAGIVLGAACAAVGLILIPRRRAPMIALGLVLALSPAMLIPVLSPHLDRHREVATTAPIIPLDQTNIDGAGYLAPTDQGHLRYAVQVDQDAYLMGRIDPEKDLVLDDAEPGRARVETANCAYDHPMARFLLGGCGEITVVHVPAGTLP